MRANSGYYNMAEVDGAPDAEWVAMAVAAALGTSTEACHGACNHPSLPYGEFDKHPAFSTGRDSNCKECRRSKRKEARQAKEASVTKPQTPQQPEQEEEPQAEPEPKPEEKVCVSCRKPKPLGDFYHQTHGLYGRMGTCKACYDERRTARLAEKRAKPPKEPKRPRLLASTCRAQGCQASPLPGGPFCEEHIPLPPSLPGPPIPAPPVRQAEPEPEAPPAVVAADPASCPHKHWYTGSDHFIERMVPGFFDTHRHAESGEEWHVCKDCGHAKGPVRFAPELPYKGGEEVPRISRYSQELMERRGRKDAS